LFVLGAQNGMRFVREQPAAGAVFVGADRQVSCTENLQDQLEFTGEGGYQIK